MKRREFISTGLNASLLAGASMVAPWKVMARDPADLIDERTYLEEILYTREEVDDWFAGKAFPFSKFHSKFGWLLNNARFRDGIDGSVSVYTYQGDDGERIMSNYSYKSCRINTYGNSFTQCHQVSDHETWQEVLAAHIQEPVRNFGIGGWSVYQAYLRMQFEEERTPSQYIIFNIYEDDHYRNLDSWRNIRVNKHPQHIEATLPYLKVDLVNDRIIECENPCPTPESYYDLCDLDKTCELFRDDFVLQIMIAHRNSALKNPRKGYRGLSEFMKTHGIETRLDRSITLDQHASEFHRKAAMFSTLKLIEKVEEFAGSKGKKVLYALTFPGSSVAAFINEGKRSDQEIISFLQARDLPYIDMLREHAVDYSRHNPDMEAYLDKYFIGHYTPLGNFFFAHLLKERITGMTIPPPIPYR